MTRISDTYALLEISEAAFNEISDKLVAAGYEDSVILTTDNAVHLDMRGLALVRERETRIPLPVVKPMRYEDGTPFEGTITADAEAIRKGVE